MSATAIDTVEHMIQTEIWASMRKGLPRPRLQESGLPQ